MNCLRLFTLYLLCMGTVLFRVTTAEAERSAPRNIYGVRSSRNIYGMQIGKPNFSSGKMYGSQGRSLGHNYFGPSSNEKRTNQEDVSSTPKLTKSWGYWDYDLEQERLARQRRDEKMFATDENYDNRFER